MNATIILASMTEVKFEGFLVPKKLSIRYQTENLLIEKVFEIFHKKYLPGPTL